MEQEMVQMIQNRNPTNIMNIVTQDGHTWKFCWELQSNTKKARRVKEMDDRDDDSSDTFNSMVSKDPISDDNLGGFIRNFSKMTEYKLNQDSLCIAGNPTNCPNSDGNEYGYLHQSLKFSYNYQMDDCNAVMTLGLADVSYMSICNDFDETVTYDRDMFHGQDNR